MNLRDLKRSLRGRSPDQLRKLREWLQTLIERAEYDRQEQPVDEHDVPKVKRGGQRTYRLEYVRCGSKKCRCASGELHGPYWYAYWSEGGRTRSQYIGKKLPTKKKRR